MCVGLCGGNSPMIAEFPHKGPATRQMFPYDDGIIGYLHWDQEMVVGNRCQATSWWSHVCTAYFMYNNRGCSIICLPLTLPDAGINQLNHFRRLDFIDQHSNTPVTENRIRKNTVLFKRLLIVWLYTWLLILVNMMRIVFHNIGNHMFWYQSISWFPDIG